MIYTVLYAAWLFTGSVRAWTLQTPLKNVYAAVAIKANGAVAAWGKGRYGADISGVASELTSGVVAVFSTRYAFTALKDDGTMVAWGDFSYGGDFFDDDDDDNHANDVSGLTFVDIVSNDDAFAAVTDEGAIYVWGSPQRGGIMNDTRLFTPPSPVKRIIPSVTAFTALFRDGTVMSWGEDFMVETFTSVAEQLVGVQKVYSSEAAFAVIRNDGSVVAWGGAWGGGGVGGTTTTGPVRGW
jgi:alpha-tubulin suppressor-like RCC1 family protein